MKPVVAVACGGVTEAAGGAALLVETGEAADLAEGLRRIEIDLPLRRRLVNVGLQRARGATWPEAARRLLGVLTAAVDAAG